MNIVTNGATQRPDFCFQSSQFRLGQWVRSRMMIDDRSDWCGRVAIWDGIVVGCELGDFHIVSHLDSLSSEFASGQWYYRVLWIQSNYDDCVPYCEESLILETELEAI